MKFSADWFTRSKHMFEKHLLRYRDQQSMFLEIGSCEGRSAIWCLQNALVHPHSRIYCVDPMNQSYANNFFSNIAETGVAFKCKLYCNFSYNVLKHFSPNQFDFVYIDGDHHSWACSYDAVTSFQLLKVGGIMAFDDYDFGSDGMSEVPDNLTCRVGMDAFLATHKNYIEILEKNHQVWIRKK